MRDVHAACASPDKELHRVMGANHYYFDQPDKLAEGLRIGCDWLQRKGFVSF